jgi:hypothetical protein
VAVQQQTGGKYWTGSGFSSPSIVWLASGTASWSQTLPLPALDGAYTVSVKATDTATPASNTSIPLTATFRVDTVAPPAPTFTKTPEDPTFETKAQFNYRDTEAGVLFVCGLDSATPNRCAAAGIEFKNLAVGTHTFTLWAVDAAGNRSASGTTWSWTILENKAFGISGTLSPQLYPGVKLPLDLNLTNPYNFTIRVTSLTVQVTGPRPTGTTACRADVKASGTTAGLALDIPANQSRQLSSFASLASWPEGWPQIDMENTNQNQDACKNTTFTLGYSGTATKS